MMNRPRTVLILIYGVAIAQLAWVLPQMPAVLATHYDGAGLPNGWMTRWIALGFHLAILGVTAAAFVGLPVLLGRIPAGRINIPHRGYWLAPERRAASVAALERWMSALGCGVVLLVIVVSGLSFHANLQPEARISSSMILAMVAAFVACLAGWIVALCRRFSKLPAA